MTQKCDECPKRVSNRQMLSLIALLIIVNVMIRYPTTPHQIGWDSYHIHSLAGAISDSGQAVWILSPLSYFGMYPLSYPSGIPFLISSFSQVSGLSIQGTIWIYTVLLGILAAVGSFMLAGLFKKNFWFQYAVALLFSTSMGLLLFTRWTISTRGTLVVLTPLLLWTFIKTQKESETKYVIIVIAMLYVMASVHRMFVLVIPFILLYLVTGLLFKIKMKVKTNSQPSKHNKFRNVSTYIFLLVAIILLLSPLFGGFGVVYSRFVRLKEIGEIIFRGMALFSRNLGPLSLFSLFGTLLLLKKTGKDRHELFILGCATILSPMIFIGTYVSTFSLLFFMFLAAYGLLLIHRNIGKRRKIVILFTSTILIISFAMSGYGQITEFQLLSEGSAADQRYLEIEGYDAAMWVMENDVGIFTGSGQIVLRISAISGKARFPGMGPTNLAYGYVFPEDINLETRSIFDLRFYTDAPIHDLDKISSRITWFNRDMNRRTLADSRTREYILRFNIETLVLNNYVENYSVFADSVTETSYCIFHNQKAQMYDIMFP